MKLPTLYKKKNNKTLFWSISTITINGNDAYEVSHGYLGGKTQTTHTEVKQGKNIGKANETTAEQQCELEARSLWNKQKDRKGYIEDLKAKDDGFKPVRPMLAHSYNEYPNKVTFPCYLQPKLDGIRCLAHIDHRGDVRLFSRQASEFVSLAHLKAEFTKLGFKNIILDGELYCHSANFQEIISAVKRDEPSPLTDSIEYHCYDIVSNAPFEQRYSVISSLLKPSWHKTSKIKSVDTYTVNTLDQIETWHKSYTDSGYEGVMLRTLSGLYVQDKRSFDLLKFKKFKDAEYKIVGASENKGKLVGTCVFHLETKDGTIFKAMPEGSQEHREALWRQWNNGTIKAGMMATVRFFTFTNSEKPVPRFPIFVTVRNYE